MKNKKAEIGTIVMMAVLVIVSVIAFSSSNFSAKKQTVNTQASGTCTTSGGCGSGGIYPCNATDGCSSSNECFAKNNLEFACCVQNYNSCPSADEFRWYGCTGQPCGNTIISQGGSGPGKLVACNGKASSGSPDSCPAVANTPTPTLTPASSPRAGCEDFTSTALCSADCKFSGTNYKCFASAGSTVKRWCCPPSGGNTQPPQESIRICGDGATTANCTFGNGSNISLGPGVCNGLTEINIKGCNPIPSNKKCSDFNNNINQCFAADFKYSCAWDSKTNTCNEENSNSTNTPAVIDTCSAPPNFVCADIPSGTNAYTACDNYQGNYVLYISTSTNSKSCGSSTKTCCQLNQFAPNNTCVTSNHSCITKNSVMETNTSACRRNNQTPVTDGTTCGDSTKACCQGAGLAPPPFTSSECSQPINCPAGFSGTYYSKSITYTTTQVTKIFYFTSPSDCASNSNYQTTIDAIKTIACRSSSSQALPINQPQVVNLDLNAPLNTPFTIENTTTVQCRNIDPTQIILSVGGYSGNSNPCHSSERVTVITEDQKTIFKCCQI